MRTDKFQASLVAVSLLGLLLLFQNCADGGRLSVFRNLETFSSFSAICSAFQGQNLGQAGGFGTCRVTQPMFDHDFDNVLNRIWYSAGTTETGLNAFNTMKFCEFMFLSERADYANPQIGSGAASTDYLEYDMNAEEWVLRASPAATDNYTLLESIDCVIPLKSN